MKFKDWDIKRKTDFLEGVMFAFGYMLAKDLNEDKVSEEYTVDECIKILLQDLKR